MLPLIKRDVGGEIIRDGMCMKPFALIFNACGIAVNKSSCVYFWGEQKRIKNGEEEK